MNLKTLLTICIILLLAISCKNNSNKTDNNTSLNNPKIKKEQKTTLVSELESYKVNFNKKADTTTKTKYKKGLNAVVNSGILESAKNIGDIAPNFKLKNAIGETISLKSYLEKGPVVLTWYRGGWCPYCNLTLHSLQEELPNFIAEGANLLALTPELPDESINTSEKHNLEFEVLSDIHNKIAKEYGVVFKLTEDVAKKYNEKFQLNLHNGDTSNELPLAVTYIINTDGKIEYAFLDADYRNRAEPSKITNFLKEMKKK
ncbi:AhpC/TSA family protein [Tenacibaculum finnmarkense genomovar finnmarkense]|uniref:thioredoxin-dependent peroxiredoxin n=1 Tax=Tenacibaculum finnmarkense genomovar finnmarkense TaxID=1458503 RepID=A0AAP1RG20_9FLAO|nr:peroxiredoxin-like family protein [Tenacibaculum finnmarkense]MBE7653249.1 redoxin domain-containing protein [Tenacibaculum finnmarkense genomovar finnmarkense]MBE7661447.1 redoxin domain-containing protein [Tenacibaculum finnmarkense genomovar finnmarkense]MBE7695550.1 redoxin domain-containing protein [Tenacibaculum finnmarkense genomovar finnmarkense]MCD8418621.1 AhpC/TSA family protein [Tenacibaculum finnmarkense genomovar finnmarkense]MCD8427790.1 AhpC/TSA family protein [Tenacibaculum